MSSIADSVKTSQDKDGMLRRALERIIQLYTDKSHFVYELLQNAEDSGATFIYFIQYKDRLEVLHNGRPFTSDNLQGLCDIGKSDKTNNLNQIGEFGVGFKSVFGICDSVRLYSVPSHYKKKLTDTIPFAVEIKDFTQPEDIEEEEIDELYTTKFVFPYVVGKSFSGFSNIDTLNNTLSKKLQNLGITTLLFMKSLESIKYSIRLEEDSIDGEYLLEKQIINDHCMLVSALGLDSTKQSNHNSKYDSETSYLRFSKTINKNDTRTVDIAFPITLDQNGCYECKHTNEPFVSVYFPTETESKLDFIVQGPYRTTPNRCSIPADDEDNIRLANKTAELLRESIIELRDSQKFNMSFLKSLPLTENQFSSYDLFLPLYEAMKNMLSTEKIIPCKDGGYTKSCYSRIARQERLATLITNELLTELVHDGNDYCWLPTLLTETNREYENVYRFLTSELKIPVVRPEDLRYYFSDNPEFLPNRSDDWLVELYGVLENVGAAFSKSKNETNMLTADIVKTSSGKFVSPYRKTEDKTYILNVFLPTDKITSDEIYFVDKNIYKKCRHFFDDILQLQQPNEYEFIISDIKKRYSNKADFDEEKHIDDIQILLKYLKNDDYQYEVNQVIKDYFVLLCKDGSLRNANSNRIYFPINAEGINIESYYKNVLKSVYFVDMDFYTAYNISFDSLSAFGVRDSILTGESQFEGIYDSGTRGRQPTWKSVGEFRWKLSIDSIKDVLRYISRYSDAKDSILKSQTIMKLLFANESRLSGSLQISGGNHGGIIETCDLIKILNGETALSWDGKWLYTESGELVSPKNVSKHDISTSIYGRLKPDSSVYDLLKFKKTESDELDYIKKQITPKQLDAFFESELKQRFGISSADLEEKYGGSNSSNNDEEEILTFPTANIKSWETLKKHAAEMLVFADPVRYDYQVRHLRVSNHSKEAKAYIHNMYRYDGVFKYACQMCHDSCSTVEAAEIFLNPESELDPMHLCLCPNCASVYRSIRNQSNVMDSFRDSIVHYKESDVTNDEQVIIPLEEHEIWFTQIHFAEVQELLKLSAQVKNKQDDIQEEPLIDIPEEKSGLSVYSGYIGKTISRKDGFKGEIKNVDDNYIYVLITEGEKAGQETKIQLSFVLKHGSVYEIE